MPEIRPFRAWRYNPALTGTIDRYVSPLFDVVTPKQLEELYREEANSIHLSVPRRGGDARPPAEIVQGWKQHNILRLDPVPALFPYYQHFTLPGEAKPMVRKGFIALVRALPWGQGAAPILRHESTIPDAVKDRLHTLRETQMQVNPTHGLYSDARFELEPYMDEAMRLPLYETEDYQGCRDVLGVIQDRHVLRTFMQAMADLPIVLADGHHRYEASVALRREMLSSVPEPTGYEPWQYHMMYLTNDQSPDLRIMATHRLIKNSGTWPAEEWRRRLEVFFTVREVDDPSELPEMIAGKPHAFGFVLPGVAYKLRAKEGLLEQLDWDFPVEVKQLDLTVLHYFILWRILGVAGPAQRKSNQISYERNLLRCLSQVEHGQADACIIVNPVLPEMVRKVASLGQTMPPKSTYFYPKVVAGFCFSSLLEEEFYTDVDFSLSLAPPPAIAL